MVPYHYAERKRELSPTRPAIRNDGSGSEPAVEPVAATRHRDVRLGFLIHDVSRMRRSAFDRLMRPLGVTRAQWWVIAHLSRQDGMTQIQLADIMDVGKASLGTIVDRLETAGLVERRPDPVDGRAKRVFMTRKSRQLLKTMQDFERVFNARILRRLSDAERNALVRMLSLIRADLVGFAEEGTGSGPGRPAGGEPRPRSRRRR
ncbi:MarR family transcriptional regulator [Reyranella sp. CPCC 100927]|nr:MarR family transcriptional regulator [Reyranella sp. CPCC 100927]